MDMKGFFMVAIVLWSLSYYCKSQEQPMQLSRDEELEIENQLERLNKSSVKAIKTQNGDIYDCVDFYKQPAFDHPLLKNHNYDFQMMPSSRPKVMMNENKPPNNVQQVSIKSGFKDKICPYGTVPIKRTTKQDLIRTKLFTKSYSARISSPAPENASFHHAIVRTKSDPNKKYNGGGTSASYYTLYNVSSSQYTSGRIKIQNGVDSIQAGWTVNPTLYGDSETRVFIYFQAGEISCFNTRCPGFVLTGPRSIEDSYLNETHPGSFPVKEFKISIYRDQVSGNWWLEFSDIQIGYWPSIIFSDLKDLATYIEWGGETYSPIGQPGPPMGSGLFLKKDARYDAYCRALSTINEAYIQEDAKNTEKYSIDIDFYLVQDWGFVPEFRHVMTYGGPGPR
ncbi:protein neprosin-like [Humulus lupulus]|uniref:protein neprosin-like n=1 Tax=Humulus lupulus TaxID=3486 RepID=UPI002B40B1A3|nr:protein neprosin-like [Humulus lupulus]